MNLTDRFFRILASLALVVVIALTWAVTAFAQLNTSKIEGTVRDKDTGQPLAGAQVVIEGTRLGNVTNQDGYYFILNVPPGRRNVTFTFTGYQKTTINEVLLLAGQTATLNANLSSTVVELNGITVESEAETLVPRDNTVSKQRLTAEKIAEIPATKLEDMMVLEAGVQTGGPDALSRGLRIRGGRLGEEAMVIDGVTVRNYTADPFRSGLGWVWEQELGSLSEDATPLEFSAGAVEQVDIITGGFQAEYGNAQSGIVNIVTKEGGPDWKGDFKYTTDETNPRTSDYGYNQVVAALGGPIPKIPNLYIQGSAEIQGLADRMATRADEGFRGINQKFVDRLNAGVRNDPVFGNQNPAFSLDMFKTGRAFYASKTGAEASLFSPPNPVITPDNWGDRSLASAKLTYYPIKGLKLIESINYSRNQYDSPRGGSGDYFLTGLVSQSDLPDRAWSTDQGDWKDAQGVWHTYIPQGYGRRVRTTNFLSGFDWDFLQKAQRSATLQFRFTRFKTQEIAAGQLRDNYFRSKETTFGNWDMHDIPFEVETFPNMDLPIEGSPEAKLYFDDGHGPWMQGYGYETPLNMVTGADLTWLSYFYTREWQDNYKADLDFQLNRTNRAKIGYQLGTFDNQKYDLQNMNRSRSLANEFNYSPNLMAAYLQNRTDLGDFVLNYGIRYDRFDPVDNWGFRNGDQWGENFKPTVIDEWSPRFDVGFPVTDRSQMRFSYGVFTQLPSMSYIFDGSNAGGLEFSRTDAFEAGLSNLLGEDMVVDLVAYYRDVQGDVASKEYFRDYYQWHEARRVRDWTTGYTNRDDGNIKGMDLTLRKRFSNNYSFNLMYTMQFSRTTGSDYSTTSEYGVFLDASTGEVFTPPDELRPINGDVTHKMTANLNYLFPEDFKSGTMYNTILGNFKVYALFTLASGQPAYDRIINGGSTGQENAAENVSWLTRRNGRPIGGVNYFRGRWDYNFDLRLTKTFRLGRTMQLSFFSDIFNVFNKKLPTPYPSGYTYESYYRSINAGEILEWNDNLSATNKVWFNNDYNGDGILTLEEQAKANIAQSMMNSTMDKSAYGVARQVRFGAEYTF
ncbi:carboxypeptidase regulatory-like domain-containing protein [bacterium]|nr:carboxypeptidase regulatory-like domain-containing protein [bacterium]